MTRGRLASALRGKEMTVTTEKPISCVCGHSPDLHVYEYEIGRAPCGDFECFCRDYTDTDEPFPLEIDEADLPF